MMTTTSTTKKTTITHSKLLSHSRNHVKKIGEFEALQNSMLSMVDTEIQRGKGIVGHSMIGGRGSGVGKGASKSDRKVGVLGHICMLSCYSQNVVTFFSVIKKDAL